MTHREWTHTLVEYVHEAAAKLYRADDGVMIGQSKGHVALFGEEPNQRKSRVFIDREHAQTWLETVVAKKDLEDRKIEGDPYIHKINGGLTPSGIVLVGDQGDLPGVMSKMSKM